MRSQVPMTPEELHEARADNMLMAEMNRRGCTGGGGEISQPPMQQSLVNNSIHSQAMSRPFTVLRAQNGSYGRRSMRVSG
eukprot:6201822-Pleurochrysis_carterae.AAC.2